MEDVIAKKYLEARELSEVTNDPENNPFQSKYKARKLLQDIKDDIQQELENIDDSYLVIIKAAIDYHLGINYIYTEEISAGQEKLDDIFKAFDEEDHLNPKVVGLLIAAWNELGLVWSTREGGIEKAHNHLSKAENLYKTYKSSSDVSPHTIHDYFLLEQSSEVEKSKSFENLHTYTLFYLAQVFKSLEQPDKSATYCMQTLRRQLQFQTYKPAEWALNCACLSQYFITRNMFAQGKHCLACAKFIMDEVNEEEDEEIIEKWKENKADISRCWVKYCLCLLETSKERMENDNVNLEEVSSDDVEKSFERFSLEVTAIEEPVPHSFCSQYEHAKKAFLLGKQHATKALQHFVLDGFVTDYVEINQDISRLYQHVAYFEPELDLKCRMYKRRIDILVPILNELNPQFYLAICRQLQFELGEIHSEMMDMKIKKFHSNPDNQTSHAAKKINSLCTSSIKYFHEFVKTLKDPKGNFPDRLEEDVERPGLIAHFYIARLYSKLIPNNLQEKLENLKLSFQYYSFVTLYAERNEEVASSMPAELEICQEMVEVLPKSMDKIRTTISSQSLGSY